MSKIIDERPASFCLPDCPFMDLDVDTQMIYADNSVAHIRTTVSCSHEDVCKMWAEREDVHRTCKGCKYDEANCTNPEPCVTNEFGGRTGYTRKEIWGEN